MTRLYKTQEANMLLGALYVQPSLFDNPKMTALSEADFSNKLHKVAYSIMANLYAVGHSKFNLGIIEAYINGRPSLSNFFYKEMELEDDDKVPQGEYYFEKLAEHGEPTTFEPAFDIVKKMSLLRQLDKNGVDVKKFYDWDAEEQKLISYQENWLEKTSLKDIANEISDSIAEVIAQTTISSSAESAQAGDGLRGLLASFKESPDYGSPSPIDMMDSITRGDRLGKFYLYSAPTGGGKSRIMMSRACFAAFDTYYDQSKREWVDNGIQEGSLFISTELDIEECQTMALAFLTGIDEEIILDGRFDKWQEEILLEAIEIMEKAPLYFEVIPDFSIQEIESTIRHYYREKDIKHVRFDYIHSSMKFLAEISSITNGMKLREDQILFMLSTKLKDLANQLHIFMESGTQVNGNWQEEELNQNLLRGRLQNCL